MIAYTKSRFHEVRVRLEAHVSQSEREEVVWECFLFIFKQGWACLFGGLLIALILATKSFWPAHAPLARYDFLFLSALTLQLILLILRMETLKEAKVILAFHVIGTLMELFKTHAGSWTYPEKSYFRIGHVPLFSGFMYASVGSYLARISRILKMRYTGFPSPRFRILLACLIYANFFSHHFIADLRGLLFLLLGVAFGPTWVFFCPYRRVRKMPLLAGFALVTLFIWGAENIGTFATIWVYPHQRSSWQPVPLAKYGSWLLLMVISFVLVTFAHGSGSPAQHETDK